MQHRLFQEGYSFRLRPVQRADAAVIVDLRRAGDRTHFLHPIFDRVEDQEAYLDRYFAQAGDYYFVIERKLTGQPEGLIGLYDLDSELRCAEWGRWILRAGSLASVESALLIYQLAFESLALQEVYCRTISENHQVVSFHDSCGLRRRRVLARFLTIRDRAYDVVEHVLALPQWPGVQEKLSRLAQMTSRRIEGPGH